MAYEFKCPSCGLHAAVEVRLPTGVETKPNVCINCGLTAPPGRERRIMSDQNDSNKLLMKIIFVMIIEHAKQNNWSEKQIRDHILNNFGDKSSTTIMQKFLKTRDKDVLVTD